MQLFASMQRPRIISLVLRGRYKSDVCNICFPRHSMKWIITFNGVLVHLEDIINDNTCLTIYTDKREDAHMFSDGLSIYFRCLAQYVIDIILRCRHGSNLVAL